MDNNENIHNNISNLELRIIIIGDEKVGKRTLAKRVQMLNSSETKNIEFNINLYNETKEKERKNKIINKLVFNNKSSENVNLEKFDFRDIETKKYDELCLKKDKERRKLMSIQKIYKFCNYNTIKINVFPCIEMQSVGNYDSEDQHPDIFDEFEKKYNKSLKGLKNEIEQIISYPAKNMHDHKEFLFLFCFDLSDFNTFENIPLYFSEINNKFNITNNYHMALIGNKNDKKKILKVQQQNILNNFIQKINIKYYEISSSLNFNFEIFFEKLFFDVFEYNKSNNYNNYNTKDFKEKFHLIITEKSNFSKSQRALKIKNDFPSPQDYNNNPYEYPLSKKTLVKLFKNKNKFKKKIFINKIGPIYPVLNNKNKGDENFIKNLHYNATIQEENIIKSLNIEETQINKNYMNTMDNFSLSRGYSFVGHHGNNSLNLRKTRRKINFEKIKEMTEALGSEININIKHKRLRKIKSYDKNQAQLLKMEINKKKMENEKILKERHYNVKLINDTIENEKRNRILEKEEKYNKKYMEKKKKIHKDKLNYFKKALKTILNTESKKDIKEPKAKFYDSISSISLKKGFTFGTKRNNKDLEINYPEYPYILDDFEKIVKKNKSKKEIKCYSDRFPKFRTEEVNDSIKKLENKQKKYELKRKKIKSNAYKDFFNNIKQRWYDNLLKKKIMKEKEDEDYNYLINNKYFLTEIQYSQVETSFPKYSLRGKCYIKKKDEYQKMDMYDIDDFYDMNYSRHKILSYEEENPNIATVRPAYPKYSFGKDERFKKISYSRKKDDNDKNWLFRNGIFGYNDKQSFLKTQNFMGLSKKLTSNNDNGVPGPGQYSLKSFADLITFKYHNNNKSCKNSRIKLNEN
jgi:hypothetical protein